MIHKQVLALAIPMIIANISTPLLGLVDTAVMGHLPEAKFLAASALGGLIFNFIFWGFGFLRMGVTGICAHAYGKNDVSEQTAILLRALLLSFLLAITLIVFRDPIRTISLILLDNSVDLDTLIARYYDIRILSAPATLGNYVIIGWFIGMQNVKAPLLIALITNISNMLMDILFVVYWQLEIAGVAYASVLAEYTGFSSALCLILAQKQHHAPACSWRIIFDLDKIKQLLILNQNLFIRTLCVIFTFAFFTSQGTQYGHAIVASNAVLLNYVTFMSYALDGIAHAAEALTGRSLGKQDIKLFKQTLNTTWFWSTMIACAFSLVYLYFGKNIIDLLTDLPTIRTEAQTYLYWLIFIPFFAFACFLLDGVFIGAVWSKAMRNTMLIATFCVFLPAWHFSQNYHNHGLWFSLSLFFTARSLMMSAVLYFKIEGLKKKQLRKAAYEITVDMHSHGKPWERDDIENK